MNSSPTLDDHRGAQADALARAGADECARLEAERREGELERLLAAAERRTQAERLAAEQAAARAANEAQVRRLAVEKARAEQAAEAALEAACERVQSEQAAETLALARAAAEQEAARVAAQRLVAEREAAAAAAARQLAEEEARAASAQRAARAARGGSYRCRHPRRLLAHRQAGGGNPAAQARHPPVAARIASGSITPLNR